jgi:cytochrome bd-type quinol oxidase subunit 2
MKLLKKWETLTPRSQRYWKVATTLLLLVFLVVLLTVMYRLEMEWREKIERRHCLTVWRIVVPSVCSLIGIASSQIWRKSNEEIDEENTGKKWRLWKRIAQTLVLVLFVVMLLAVWPSVGFGIVLVAVGTAFIIKVLTDR